MSEITVWVTEDCTACALCADACPDLFEIAGDISVPKDADWELYRECLDEATESCPEQAIRIE